VLVGERLQLLLLDVTAVRGLLDEALGRRQIVQMNRVVQFNPFLGRGGAAGQRPPRRAQAREEPAISGRLFSDL
jgi:hypothetical protein